MKINKEDETMIVFSTNDEDFDYEDLEEALEAAFDCQFADDELLRVWEGDLQCKKASAYAPMIVDCLGNKAYSDCPEFSDGWPHSTIEQDQVLQDLIKNTIDAWADKHNLQPTFGKVEKLGMRVFKRVNVRDEFDIDNYKEVYDED